MEKEESGEEQQEEFSQKEEEVKGKAVHKCNILQYYLETIKVNLTEAKIKA